MKGIPGPDNQSGCRKLALILTLAGLALVATFSGCLVVLDGLTVEDDEAPVVVAPE